MSTVEKIASEVSNLAPKDQAEVLDFVEFLKRKHCRMENADWDGFSLSQAMRGMEDEPDLYDAGDIRESIK